MDSVLGDTLRVAYNSTKTPSREAHIQGPLLRPPGYLLRFRRLQAWLDD